MEEENELLDDEEFADGDIIEFLRGLMKECSCMVEKHKAKQRQPALPLFRSQATTRHFHLFSVGLFCGII